MGNDRWCDAMSAFDGATPLYVHTLDTLCAELVSGRAVLLDDQGETFQLTSAETRSLFQWYRSNPSKWAQKNTREDVEALVDQLAKPPPELPRAATAERCREPRPIHLKSIRAHRFAGLHRYGTVDAPPADFWFEFGKPITLVEGENAAGKTSLLSAIGWCLTGYVYRSQRPPAPVDTPVSLQIDDVEAGAGGAAPHDMTAITPMPPAEVLASLGDESLPLDTWVELTFEDDAGNPIATIRRSVERTRRGKTSVVPPDLSRLGLDPLAAEVGTRLPGLIPYVSVGTPCELGQAVATLTGIRPLEDLAEHARKSRAKLQKDLVKDREAEITASDREFLRVREELLTLLRDHREIHPGIDPPVPGPGTDVEAALTTLERHLENRQAQALEQCASILGPSFDPHEWTARKDLVESVGPAMGQVDSGGLRRLPSIARLEGLAEVGEEDLTEAEALTEQLRAEAVELAQLQERAEVAARLRLYARIAGWVKSLPEAPRAIEECPVCSAPLEGKTDQVTGRAIADHIREHLERESDHLEQTLYSWERSALATLARDLPARLAAELSRDLPDRPVDLMARGLAEELFQSEPFRRTLAPLKAGLADLCSQELGALNAFQEPVEPAIPECFEDKEGGIRQAMRRVGRAIAFARWHRENRDSCDAACTSMIGEPGAWRETAASPDGPVAMWPLAARVVALERMIHSISPISEALAKVAAMRGQLGKRRQMENRIALYARAAEAIEPLVRLDELARRQVASLMTKLSSETRALRDDLYNPAFVGAPRVQRTDVGTDGSLEMDAVAGGTRASALHVSNASDLRATLLAFLIAFWEHLLQTRGGLSLLLLDDLQELFDAQNRRRVANTMPSLVERGGRLVVTTNDRDFRRQIAASARRTLGSDVVDQRHIHPLNAVRSCIELGVLREAVEKKERAFLDPANENQAQPARDYLNSLRIYLENRLVDFFDTADPGLPEAPTLSDLINAIRARMSSGQEQFRSLAFGGLVSDSALKSNSAFLRLMNQSHHGREHEITFKDVWDARGECARVQRLVQEAHEAYEHWLRRDAREPAAAMPAPPKPLEAPSLAVPVLEDLAAFTADHSGTEMVQSEELLTGAWLENRAVYVVATRNFGFAGPIHSRAIVDVSEAPVEDNRLVIALHQQRAYARRLLRAALSPEMVALGSEAEDPLKRPPSLLLPTAEVRLLKVVGILLDDRPVHPRAEEEAQLVDNWDLIDEVQLAFKVTGESALPLALRGQTILGGGCLAPDELDAHKGSLVAVATSGGAALKRIGDSVRGAPHVRQFESVGGLGESWLVRTEDVADAFGDLPLMHGARRVLGVLYD